MSTATLEADTHASVHDELVNAIHAHRNEGFPPQHRDEPEHDYLTRVIKEVAALPDTVWFSLSQESRDWVESGIRELKARKHPPSMPGYPLAPAAPVRERPRLDDFDVEEQAEAYTPETVQVQEPEPEAAPEPEVVTPESEATQEPEPAPVQEPEPVEPPHVVEKPKGGPSITAMFRRMIIKNRGAAYRDLVEAFVGAHPEVTVHMKSLPVVYSHTTTTMRMCEEEGLFR